MSWLTSVPTGSLAAVLGNRQEGPSASQSGCVEPQPALSWVGCHRPGGLQDQPWEAGRTEEAWREQGAVVEGEGPSWHTDFKCRSDFPEERSAQQRYACESVGHQGWDVRPVDSCHED